jgi:type IV pilus assembly protein PilP
VNRLIILGLLTGLSACSGGAHDDLDQFIQDAGQGMHGKVDPIPEVKPYEPFIYEAFNEPEPFKPRKLKPSSGSGGGLIQPDLNRRKEALEAFELEKLKMVGTLEQNNVYYALIKAPDNSLHRVKTGNHIGVNYGTIVAISAGDVKVKEIVEDSAGDWSEKENSIALVEETGQDQPRK